MYYSIVKSNTDCVIWVHFISVSFQQAKSQRTKTKAPEANLVETRMASGPIGPEASATKASRSRSPSETLRKMTRNPRTGQRYPSGSQTPPSLKLQMNRRTNHQCQLRVYPPQISPQLKPYFYWTLLLCFHTSAMNIGRTEVG